ncbi:demethoxyubiquinone hydroxylase family protein [Alphaproteobacteria bacterium]|nr:demethoxyubiquinone hydroxylase family protein [Alphaproteobacteria bacterium]MDC1209674.1 demethoxyubiquinone hydroxylase family protein [Pseudomonadota bacterium]
MKDKITKDAIEAMLRVDHAGETAAAKIYDGQLAILGNSSVGSTIQHMKDQEQEHLDTFNKLLIENDTRPTALLPIWNIMGFGLGMASAIMGKKAAMACTIAVEEVIGEHYSKQAEALGTKRPELKKTLMKFRDEELDHLNIGVDHDGRDANGYQIMKTIIQFGCRTAIKISEKI